MKLKFMLQGGYMPPYVVYQPVLTNTGRTRTRGGSSGIFDSISSSSSKSSNKDSDNKDDVTAKDILLMLEKTKALPIDRKAISARVLSLIGISSISGAVDPSLMAMEYLRTMNDLKNASFAYDEYASTWRLAQSKDALNEVALSPDNKLYVKTEDGNISPISIEIYQLHKDELGEPLTNSLLMHYRAYMSSNPAILDSVANAISLDTVNSLIHSYIGTIGYDESSKTTMLKKKDLTILNGVEALQKAADDGDYNSEAGLDGIYALVETNHNNVEDIDKMLNYVYDMLPKRAKALLDYHGNGEKGAKEIIAQFVTAGTIKKTNFSDTLKFDINGKKVGSKSSSTGSSETDFYTDLFQNIITGNGGSYNTFTIEDKDGYTYQISGTLYPSLLLHSDKPLPLQCTLSELMTKYNILGIRDASNKAITFGSLVLNPSEFNNIVYLNNSNATRVILPIKQTQDGTIVPDLEFATENKEVIDKINQEINETGQLSQDTITKLLELRFINPYTGEVDLNKLLPYLLVDGLGTGENVSKDNNFVTETDDDRYIQLFENGVYQKADADHQSSYKFKFDTNGGWPWDWFGLHDRLYKGTIYIPITQNRLLGATAAGTNIKQGVSVGVESQYLRGTMRRNFNDTSSEKLGNI